MGFLIVFILKSYVLVLLSSSFSLGHQAEVLFINHYFFILTLYHVWLLISERFFKSLFIMTCYSDYLE